MPDWQDIINTSLRELCRPNVEQFIKDAEARRKFWSQLFPEDKRAMAKKKPTMKREYLVIIRKKGDGKTEHVAINVRADHIMIDHRGTVIFYDGNASYGTYTNIVMAIQGGTWVSFCRTNINEGEVPDAAVQTQAAGD